jgi:hypothetical protein
VDIFKDFISEVEWVIEACGNIVSEYPPYIKEQATAYLKKLNLVKEKSDRAGGFSYIMPFWFREMLSIDNDTCRTIAIGNTFALLYFLSQDEIIDADPGEYKSDILPLSNLFFLNFISCYRKIIPTGSAFWEYFDRYIHEWANSILWERNEHLGKLKEYEESDFIMFSRKAAPLKIPFAALSLIAGKASYIEHFSRMIDYDQITYQIIDDWRDLSEDLKRGNYTYLLVKVMEYCKISDINQLKEEHIKKAVLFGNVPENMIDTAIKYNKIASESIQTLELSYLNDYLKMEKSICKKILSGVHKKRKSMTKSGLEQILEKA